MSIDIHIDRLNNQNIEVLNLTIRFTLFIRTILNFVRSCPKYIRILYFEYQHFSKLTNLIHFNYFNDKIRQTIHGI